MVVWCPNGVRLDLPRLCDSVFQQDAMFSSPSPEQGVPAEHPLRPIRPMVDTVLKRLSPSFVAGKGQREFGAGGPQHDALTV